MNCNAEVFFLNRMTLIKFCCSDLYSKCVRYMSFLSQAHVRSESYNRLSKSIFCKVRIKTLKITPCKKTSKGQIFMIESEGMISKVGFTNVDD